MKQIIQIKHSGSRSPEPNERELRNRSIAGDLAAEGMVLLKNNGVLPLRAGMSLAVFGPAGHLIKGGTGSGDVNQRSVTSLTDGLTAAGYPITSRDWLSDFDRRYAEARQAWKQRILGGGTGEMDVFHRYATNPFRMPAGRPISAKDLEGAEAALYVVSRVAGEGKDRLSGSGDYALSANELEDLRVLQDTGLPLVLIVNTGGPVDLTPVLPMLSAVLYISQPGQEGGTAAARILSGKVSPSGRLTATWAKSYRDYPCADSFSYLNGNLDEELYREGIYVGYRYFDTFGVEPLFPFGFGLSYTDFAVSDTVLHTEAPGALSVSLTVTNTGKRSGKQVVQLYLSCPQTGLPKEFRRLTGFAKTGLLEPGQSQRLTVRIDSKSFASFDESQSAWTVEQGLYGLWIGESSADLSLCGAVSVAETRVLEQVTPICPLQAPEKRCPLEAPDLTQREQAWHQTLLEQQLPVFSYAPAAAPGLTRPETKTDAYAEKLSETLPVEQLIPIICGEISRGQGALGAAGIRVPGAAGETSAAFENYGIAGVVMADGPAGLRLMQRYHADRETGELVGDNGILTSVEGGFFLDPDRAEPENADCYYQFCTAFPVGTLLAQSFDVTVMERFGAAVAEEMEEYHVSWWLAPGMNIQRNPLCGRNFEYYSEDPLLAGLMAAAETRAVQAGNGVGVTIKHFCCNNNEDNRMGINCILTERALREIYLRGFEIAVRQAQPMCIMTSYNLVNGVHAANNRDLCTVAAREEWGFAGVIMTDWTTTFPQGGSIAWKCVEAGNDLMMPGCEGDQESVREALASGKLSERLLRDCARRLFSVILCTNQYVGAESYDKLLKR